MQAAVLRQTAQKTKASKIRIIDLPVYHLGVEVVVVVVVIVVVTTISMSVG